MSLEATEPKVSRKKMMAATQKTGCLQLVAELEARDLEEHARQAPQAARRAAASVEK